MIRNRLLALVLGVVLLMSTFAFAPAVMADEAVATTVDSSKLDLMKTLGVFPADVITRSHNDPNMGEWDTDI